MPNVFLYILLVVGGGLIGAGVAFYLPLWVMFIITVAAVLGTIWGPAFMTRVAALTFLVPSWLSYAVFMFLQAATGAIASAYFPVG